MEVAHSGRSQGTAAKSGSKGQSLDKRQATRTLWLVMFYRKHDLAWMLSRGGLPRSYHATKWMQSAKEGVPFLRSKQAHRMEAILA